MLFTRLELKNLLSFQDTKVDLRPLNVLIGPNASGKSNLIDVMSLLRAAPASLSDAIRQGGGVRSWISGAVEAGRVASVICDVELEPSPSLRYTLAFAEEANAVMVVEESLCEGSEEHFTRQGSSARRRVSESGGSTATNHIPVSESFFSVYKNPSDPTRITNLGGALDAVRIYRDFSTSGARAPARYGSSVSAPKDCLSENGDNLALMLQELDFLGKMDVVNEYLKRFWDRFVRVKVRLEGGYAQTYVEEGGMKHPLSAARLSDGTLKFLCLLAALLNPNAPPLMCIEEPEAGMHPEAIPIVVDLLVEASERMQLIVTTHSEALVDALSDRPEDVLVCERDFDGGTQFKRLDKAQLGAWLERYTLGELWRKGEIGGTRW
jgi:predicted ATPase